MSDNVGLSTPRGSGTSGYVQRNLAHLKPRDRDRGAPYAARDLERHRQRQPDKGILEHERKRAVEVKVFELRDKLEDEGVDEDEIDKQGGTEPRKGLKMHQVHELADAKIKESERLRSALKISKDYEEGGHWKRQEERLRKAVDRDNAADRDKEGSY
ncbi:RNA-splicing factor [Apiospora aurea]|uniref:RNA-splicing factor n=1 Tax=Apiospora aurea TaxID=335848 RepID=A0ABR1QWI3_9PEZI